MNKKITMFAVIFVAAIAAVYFWGKDGGKTVPEVNGNPEENPVFSARYVFPQAWPPAIESREGAYSCAETSQETSGMADAVSERRVDGRTYCVRVSREGAAGGVYASYVYERQKDGRLVLATFTLRYPNCDNYDTAEREACAREREAFDLDATVDRIIEDGAWERVKTAVITCEAEGIFQTHAREVRVNLRDGGTITAIEPEIDDIFDIVRDAVPRCGTIRMATE